MTSGLMFAYSIFLCWNGLSSQPPENQRAFDESEVSQRYLKVVSFLITVGSALVTTVRTGTQVSQAQVSGDQSSPFRADFLHGVSALLRLCLSGFMLLPCPFAPPPLTVFGATAGLCTRVLQRLYDVHRVVAKERLEPGPVRHQPGLDLHVDQARVRVRFLHPNTLTHVSILGNPYSILKSPLIGLLWQQFVRSTIGNRNPLIREPGRMRRRLRVANPNHWQVGSRVSLRMDAVRAASLPGQGLWRLAL
jgi:hypothetical protein